MDVANNRCISFESYIKPQQSGSWMLPTTVVYLLIPTSNHNAIMTARRSTPVVYLLIPTSNHNLKLTGAKTKEVVYLLIPTSNHNPSDFMAPGHQLYIF